MKFSPKCRTKILGMMYTILGSFCSFLNWEGADIRPQIRPRKIPAVIRVSWFSCVLALLYYLITCNCEHAQSVGVWLA